jgi:hypothetical protein
MKIFPHGENDVIVIICEYTVDKDRLVKAKITGHEGKDKAKMMAQEKLPADTEFSFRWKVANDTAKLDDVKGAKVELLKSHLEGEYRPK